jgi:uncharacterized protein YgfB (UPF0149 family)
MSLTTEDTENTERENVLQCELSAWHALALAKQKLLHEATRERDEAREELATLCREKCRDQRERDEAREALRKAIRFVEAYEPHSRAAEVDQNKTLSIIRKALEGAK